MRWLSILFILLPLWSTGQQSRLLPVIQPNGDTVYAEMPALPDSVNWRYVERMPEATIDVDSFIKANVRYPEDARRKKIQGRVAVVATIDAEGYVMSTYVLKPMYPSIDAEARRVVSMLPPFIPARNGRENVSVEILLPVEFKP